jgi:photosystem II stability/assembly factor-like uncharacterized protein
MVRVIQTTGVVFCLCCSVAHAQWQRQEIATDADFRGLSVVSSKVAWVSGTKGTFAHTTDGGKTWALGQVPGAEKLDFRDVEAFSDSTAYLLSAGPGEDSRIYKTTDSGKTWLLRYKNADREGFFDAIAFWDDRHGIALGDPVKGKFQLITTDDGGEHWRRLPAESLPAALPGEGAFAASGTCLIARGENDVWFVTGEAKVARVFHSGNRGKSWRVAETPLAAGVTSAGIFSIAFRDRDHGIIIGGDYKQPNRAEATSAMTADGGKTWTLAKQLPPYCSAVAWAKDRWIAVGTSGTHASLDDGATWKELDRQGYNSVAFTPDGDGWAAGPKGRLAKFVK